MGTRNQHGRAPVQPRLSDFASPGRIPDSGKPNDCNVKITLCLLLILFVCPAASAQIDHRTMLFQTLKTNDSLLFNLGFNTCDLAQFDTLLAVDFEFYHDEAGITASKADFIREVEENICSAEFRPERRLVSGSLEVHELRSKGVLYGAIQNGRHEFYVPEQGGNRRLTSVARFTHVWLIEDGVWKLSRVYSYDHQKNQAADEINKKQLFEDRAETEKWLKRLGVPALGIGYIQDGSIREVSVYGELEAGKSAPVGTIFNVASLTKPVTAVVALKLVNVGKWDLDTPLERYWTDPDLIDDPRSKKLTTRHVLSHQSGFPNWRYQHPDGKLAFEFDPGTGYQYSGEGFEYLRRALENKFNSTLDQLASALIFDSLQMNDTHYFWSKDIDESRFARWHDKSGEVYETHKNKSANAADDLLTTVEDYCRFLIHVMDGAGLSSELFEEMISDQTRVKHNQHFGLGWLVDENIGRDEFAITHGGDDKGVHTIVFILPKSRQGLVIFTNGDNGTETYIEVILHYLNDLGQGIIDVETR